MNQLIKPRILMLNANSSCSVTKGMEEELEVPPHF